MSTNIETLHLRFTLVRDTSKNNVCGDQGAHTRDRAVILFKNPSSGN